MCCTAAFRAAAPAAARAIRRSTLTVRAKKTEAASTDADVGPAGLAAIAAGLVANPVMLFSEYTLKTTGSGLPPGPGGLYGALGELVWGGRAAAGPGSKVEVLIIE